MATAALVVASIVAALLYVSFTLTRNAEQGLQRGMLEAGTVVDQQYSTLVQTLTVTARLVADLPRLKAAVDLGDPPTVTPIALDYQQQLGVALLALTDRRGALLASAGSVAVDPAELARLPSVARALTGLVSAGAWAHDAGPLQLVSVPIVIGLDRPEIMGTLTVGLRLDDALARQFRRTTESDIAFAVDGRIQASTLPDADRERLAVLLGADGVQTVALSDGEFAALRRPLAAGTTPVAHPAAVGLQPDRAGDTAGLAVLLLRSRTEQLRFLTGIRAGLWAMAIVAVLASILLSYGVARTVTRPLATITEAMREMSATGDLSRKLARRVGADWQDEDAALLASTFDSLTDALERFQREAAQRERLSALGRLSTVIAHEVRNPLMIIKGSLRTLSQPDGSRDSVAQALSDVNDEVARLNRVVNDVLDFARPIHFECAPADVAAICADADRATRTEPGAVTVAITTTTPVLPFVTDAERLRTALVNLLMNARQAVLARGHRDGTHGHGPDIALTIAYASQGGVPTVTLVLRDTGIGVPVEDQTRVFDPYFTTKRTGSGLGLAIAKNIVDGLNGHLTLESTIGVGTQVTMTIPSESESR